MNCYLKKLISSALSFILLFGALPLSSLAAGAPELSEIVSETNAQSCISELKTARNLTYSANFSYEYSATAGQPGTFNVGGLCDGEPAKWGRVFDYEKLFDGDIEVHCDINSFGENKWILFAKQQDDTLVYTDDCIDITLSLCYPADIQKLFLAQPTGKALRSWKYDIYLSDKADNLYESGNLAFSYDNPNADRYQTFQMPKSKKAQFVGIRILRGIVLEDYINAKIDVSAAYARLCEIAVFGEYDYSNVGYTDPIEIKKCLDELKTESNLTYSGNYKYTVSKTLGTPGTVSLDGVQNGSDLSPAEGSIYNDNLLFDGDSNTHCDTSIYGAAGQVTGLKEQNGTVAYTDDTTDLTVSLLHPTKLKRLFVAQPQVKALRSWKYNVYLSDSAEDLYSDSNLKFSYENASAPQHQAFVMPENTRAQFIGIRILRQVVLEDFVKSGVNINASYTRIGEVAVFGEYDCAYYNYTAVSSDGGFLNESGRAMDGEIKTFSAPYCKEGYVLDNWTVNGAIVTKGVETFRKKNVSTITLPITSEGTISANYKQVPTDYIDSKFTISRKLGEIAVPYGTTANELLFGFGNPWHSLTLTEQGRTVAENELIKPDMELAIIGRNGENRGQLKVVLCGDADKNGSITVSDIVKTVDDIIKQSADEEELFTADYNGDGKITVSDIALVRYKMLDDTVLESYAEQYINIDSAEHKFMGREVLINDTDRSSVNRKALLMDMAGCGVQFKVNACGDVSLDIKSKRYSTLQEVWLTVIVDGKESELYLGDDYNLHREFVVAENLPRGIHTVEIYRQGTTGDSIQELFGIRLNGKVLNAPENKQLLIDFAGDSITCGVGNMVKGNVKSGRMDNSFMAYSTITARTLNADWALMAKGGASLIDDSASRACIPKVYLNYTESSYNPSAYDFTRKADVVVVNLGTNDYNVLRAKYGDEQKSKAEFKKALQDFSKTIIEKNGSKVKIVFAFGMMTRENYMDDVYREVAAELSSSGYNAGYCRLPTNNDGWGDHPTVEGDIAAAKVLSEYIKSIL